MRKHPFRPTAHTAFLALFSVATWRSWTSWSRVDWIASMLPCARPLKSVDAWTHFSWLRSGRQHARPRSYHLPHGCTTSTGRPNMKRKSSRASISSLNALAHIRANPSGGRGRCGGGRGRGRGTRGYFGQLLGIGWRTSPESCNVYRELDQGAAGVRARS